MLCGCDCKSVWPDPPMHQPILQGRCKADALKIKHHIAESQARAWLEAVKLKMYHMDQARVSEYEKQTNRVEKRAGP